MSGGSKKQFKQFHIDSVEDACVVLGNLISGVTINLKKYKEYAHEAEALLENTETEYIPAKEYEDVNDKLLFRQREILKLSADYQSSSFSYANLRKYLEKKGYLKSALSPDTGSLLNEWLDVRNWSFHNPQSLMVAAKEVAEKGVPTAWQQFVKIVPQLNPVITQIVDKYELIVLASLTIHAQKRIEQFETVLQCMKSDYQELFDSLERKPLLISSSGFSSEVQYEEQMITGKLVSQQSDIVQISMAIQKSKYDGTDEAFNKWSVQFNDAKEKIKDECES